MTSGPLFYVLATLGFILIVVVLKKFNDGMIDKNVQKAKEADFMPELAKKLGLKYQDLSHHKDTTKNIMDVGSKIFGEYKGVKIEIAMHMRADHENVPLGYQSAYSYKSERWIKIDVKNPEKKKFAVMPKSKNAVIKPSGNQNFDEKLMLDGNLKIPSSFLSYFADIGWMNLKLSGETLTFNDNFYDQFQSGLKGMEMMSVVHPIWKTSATNWKPDLDNVQEFIDKLIKLCEETELL